MGLPTMYVMPETDERMLAHAVEIIHDIAMILDTDDAKRARLMRIARELNDTLDTDWRLDSDCFDRVASPSVAFDPAPI